MHEHPLRLRVDRVVSHALDGDCHELLGELERLLPLAEQADDPGWAAIVHAVLAVVRSRAGTGMGSFESTVAGEQALTRAEDDGLRCTAAYWLAIAYYRVRLYELAVPHLRHATQLRVGLDGRPTSPASFQLVLAGIHLRWADDLTLLGDPSLGPQIDELTALGAQAAGRAAALITDAEPPVLHTHVELMLAGAAIELDTEDAVRRLLAVLDRLSGDHLVDDRALVHPRLALGLARLGRMTEAREQAALGLACLHDGTDLPTSITAQHVALLLQVEDGDVAAAPGLRLVRTLARGWWEQRLRDLHSVRSALAARELRTLHRIAHRDARRDPLTGVGNRRALDERLASDGPLAVVLMDLDRFKAVNDTLGHVAGDALLCRMAERIRDCARPDDLVARLGGDEFVVVCTDRDGRTAQLLVDRLRAAFRPGWSEAPEAHAYGLGVSLGHASMQDGLHVSELLSAADVRLYADKSRHREVLELDRRVGA